jgi:hypothetical protein
MPDRAKGTFQKMKFYTERKLAKNRRKKKTFFGRINLILAARQLAGYSEGRPAVNSELVISPYMNLIHFINGSIKL